MKLINNDMYGGKGQMRKVDDKSGAVLASSYTSNHPLGNLQNRYQ
jgi:hypothetical protein